MAVVKNKCLDEGALTGLWCARE